MKNAKKLKNILRHSIAYLLLFLFIGAGTGFTLYRHHCLSADKVHYSLVPDRNSCDVPEEKAEEESCCETKKQSRAESGAHKSCCTDTEFSRQLQVEEYVPVYFTEVPVAFPLLLPAESFFLNPVAVAILRAAVAFPDHPPLKQGRDILAFTQIFRI